MRPRGVMMRGQDGRMNEVIYIDDGCGFIVMGEETIALLDFLHKLGVI